MPKTRSLSATGVSAQEFRLLHTLRYGSHQAKENVQDDQNDSDQKAQKPSYYSAKGQARSAVVCRIVICLAPRHEPSDDRGDR